MTNETESRFNPDYINTMTMNPIKGEIIDLLGKCVELGVQVKFETPFNTLGLDEITGHYVVIPFGTQIFDIYEILKRKIDKVEIMADYMENAAFFYSAYTKLKEGKQ